MIYRCDGEHFLEEVGLKTVPEDDWFCAKCVKSLFLDSHPSKLNLKEMSTKTATKIMKSNKEAVTTTDKKLKTTPVVMEVSAVPIFADTVAGSVDSSHLVVLVAKKPEYQPSVGVAGKRTRATAESTEVRINTSISDTALPKPMNATATSVDTELAAADESVMTKRSRWGQTDTCSTNVAVTAHDDVVPSKDSDKSVESRTRSAASVPPAAKASDKGRDVATDTAITCAAKGKKETKRRLFPFLGRRLRRWPLRFFATSKSKMSSGL
jgi:hypothetical protein